MIKNKFVTNLLDNISKARNLIDKGDLHEIYKRVYLFNKIENDLNIQLGKFTKDSTHVLDFNYLDIKELAQEIYSVIQSISTKFKFSNYLKEIQKHDVITVPKLNKFSEELAKYYLIDTYLRSCYKVMSFFALVLHLYEETYKEQENQKELEFSNEITSLIKSFI